MEVPLDQLRDLWITLFSMLSVKACTSRGSIPLTPKSSPGKVIHINYLTFSMPFLNYMRTQQREDGKNSQISWEGHFETLTTILTGVHRPFIA